LGELEGRGVVGGGGDVAAAGFAGILVGHERKVGREVAVLVDLVAGDGAERRGVGIAEVAGAFEVGAVAGGGRFALGVGQRIGVIAGAGADEHFRFGVAAADQQPKRGGDVVGGDAGVAG